MLDHDLAAPLVRMLGDHAEDVYAVIAALTGESRDAVRCLSGEETLRLLDMQQPDTRTILLYQAQLLWLISAQLHSLLGSGSYPVPDVSSLMKPERHPKQKGDCHEGSA